MIGLVLRFSDYRMITYQKYPVFSPKGQNLTCALVTAIKTRFKACIATGKTMLTECDQIRSNLYSLARCVLLYSSTCPSVPSEVKTTNQCLRIDGVLWLPFSSHHRRTKSFGMTAEESGERLRGWNQSFQNKLDRILHIWRILLFVESISFSLIFRYLWTALWYVFIARDKSKSWEEKNHLPSFLNSATFCSLGRMQALIFLLFLTGLHIEEATPESTVFRA